MRKNKRNKFLGLLLGLVTFTGLASVTSTFAWWTVLKRTQEVTIEVGERLTIVVSTDDVTNDGYLIPLDETKLSGQVYYVTTSVEVLIAGSVDFSLYELEVSDAGRTFMPYGGQEGDEINDPYVDYFNVRLDRTSEGVGGHLLTSANPYTIETITSTIGVDVEFSLIVPASNQNDSTASDLSKGNFTITLDFELLEK